MGHLMRFWLLILLTLCISNSYIYAQTSITYNYPAAFKTNDKIEKFGYVVNDPFRWTEDLNSKQTIDWLNTQSDLIRKYRNSVFSRYTVIEREIAYAYYTDSVSNYIKNKIGGYYFTERYDYQSDNSPIIEYKKKINHGWGKLISTAQFLRNDKDAISINFISVSWDDSLIAIGISHGGSDWNEIIIVDAITQKILDSKISWTKYSIAWNKHGFYYTKFDKPEGGNELSSVANNSSIFYHQIGTNPDNDIMVSEKNGGLKTFYTIGKGKFLIMGETKIQNGKRFGVLSYAVANSSEPAMMKPFMVGLNMNPDDIEVIGEANGAFIAQSHYKTPFGCIMAYNYEKTNDGKILIETFNQPLLEAHYLNDKLICIYNDKGNYLCYVFSNTGALLKNIQLPQGVSVSGFDRIYADTLTYYYINSFSMPKVTMRLNLNTLKSELPDEYAGFALSSKYTTKVVSYKSKDSTDIYMYLTYNNDMKPDSNTPVVMYAYGGFGVVTSPFYDPCFGMLLRRNAIIAVPLIRGGGEFGTLWHNAGRRENKQNSIDDVAYAAKWLINNQYSSANKIAITGGSQGGWLMGNAAIQYPELFRVAVPRAGVYDMLRYNLYSSLSAVGIPEYGDPDDSTDFGNLLKISPVYHINKGIKYPSVLQFIGDNDNRVVPFHTYKLTAALQENASADIPYLVYVEENAGHNVSNTNFGLEQMAFMYTFIMDRLGMNVHVVKSN